MFSILSKINLFGSWRGRSNDDQHEHRDYQNFNTNVIERDIDEIYSSLATGNTDDNLGFELLLRLNEKTLDKIPLKMKQGRKQKKVAKRKNKKSNLGSQREWKEKPEIS